jgi:UDP-2,3-diacylglucosamine pyrophosphatase LpxH
MEVQTTFVISDLHVGIGDKFDIFHSPDKPAAFEGFIEHARAQPAPVELIVNGDVVDFLQVKPWNDYSRSRALDKIQSIAGASADIFKALGGLFQDPRHRITVLLGNHDVELAFPEVWAVLRDAILSDAPAHSDSRLVFVHDRTTYRSTTNGVLVHVEHGNKDDPWNAINYTRLVDDAETGTSEFAYPPGTKFVYETMNGLKNELQFVDVLKPEVPAVILLIMALRPWKSMRSLPSAVRAKLLAVMNGWLSRLRQAVGGPPLGQAPADETNPEEVLGHDLARGYADYLGHIRQSLRRAQVDDLEHFLHSDESEGRTDQPVFAGVLDGIKVRLIAAALWSLARFRARQGTDSEFTTADHPNDLFAVSARGRLKGNVKVAIFGHTHEALKTEFDDGRLYVNSGTWANLVKLPRSMQYGELLDWMRELADNTFERTSFPTFVRIDPSDLGATVGLHLWSDRRAEELWKKDISR